MEFPLIKKNKLDGHGYGEKCVIKQSILSFVPLPKSCLCIVYLFNLSLTHSVQLHKKLQILAIKNYA